jgi:putative hydrolase of the HAD superfamily
MAVDLVGLDADDTLWHSEDGFRRVEAHFCALLAPYVGPDVDLIGALGATQVANLASYGYGAKSFMLAMVECALDLTGGRVAGSVLAELLDHGRALLRRPVELLDTVADTVADLHQQGYRLLVITKGDLVHQLDKVAASGLADCFEAVEVLTDKNPGTYAQVLARRGVPPQRFAMVGNSLRSDVLPVLALGGRAAHLPYPVTWMGEVVDHPGPVTVLDSFAAIPSWLAGLGG